MEFSPSDAGLFRSAIDAMKESLPQAQLRISEEGLHISGMDTTHVQFIDYRLAAGDCSILEVKAPIVIGLNMGVLAKVLSSVGAHDSVTMSAKKDKFIIKYANTKCAKTATYEINTLDMEADTLEVPDVAYDASVSAKTTDIGTVIKEVGGFGDDLTFTLDADGFHISASGDFGTAKQTLESIDERDMTVTGDVVSAKFGTRYVTNIFKGCTALSVNTQIEFDSGKPMRCSFRFGNASYFHAYLAPKIIDE